MRTEIRKSIQRRSFGVLALGTESKIRNYPNRKPVVIFTSLSLRPCSMAHGGRYNPTSRTSCYNELKVSNARPSPQLLVTCCRENGFRRLHPIGVLDFRMIKMLSIPSFCFVVVRYSHSSCRSLSFNTPVSLCRSFHFVVRNGLASNFGKRRHCSLCDSFLLFTEQRSRTYCTGWTVTCKCGRQPPGIAKPQVSRSAADASYPRPSGSLAT